MAKCRLQKHQPLHVLCIPFPNRSFESRTDAFEIATYDVITTVQRDRRGEFPKHIGFPNVIAIEKTNISAASPIKALFPRSGNTLVRGCNNHDTHISFRTVACNLQRPVRRPIDNDNRFKIPESLRYHRCQTSSKVTFNVVYRDNNRYNRMYIITFHYRI